MDDVAKKVEEDFSTDRRLVLTLNEAQMLYALMQSLNQFYETNYRRECKARADYRTQRDTFKSIGGKLENLL